ncbi:hypothetical protein ACTMTI_54525 [Nonomuraea sp. H19]|uniref:hypothetical protein n=1 Tax=Nonomuraea sp. H19 TaxID=3452206 RepID=UPI003F89D4DD
MIKSLAGTVLVAAAATTLMAAPASASSSAAATSASTATVSETTTTAKPQLIRTRVYFGRCKDTCRVKVRVKNISGKRLFNVRLNASLKVNGRKAGSCYDYVGTINPYRVKWAYCTVRSGVLVDEWNDYLDGYGSFRYRASTYVSYRYYN